jgi:excisionase family DNA binding protein
MDSPEVRNSVEQEWMRALEVADYLGVTQQRVSQLAAGGGLPAPRMVRGRKAWKRAVVERWAERHWWGTRSWRVPR